MRFDVPVAEATPLIEGAALLDHILEGRSEHLAAPRSREHSHEVDLRLMLL